MSRPEQRFRVDFPIFLNWQDNRRTMRQAPGRCVDLSASGARVEARDSVQVCTVVLVTSEQFGRMGSATIRYCRREGMKHILGLQFSTAFGLSDPARKKILDKVLQRPATTKGIGPDAASNETVP